MENIVFIVLLYTLYYFLYKNRSSVKVVFIKSYEFHPTLFTKVKEKYPHLSDKEIAKVFDGLRDYFLFCFQAKKKMVAMPSQVVDVAWHEFILFTREYESFSKKAIGSFYIILLPKR